MAFAHLYDEKVIEEEFSSIRPTVQQHKLARQWIEKIKNKELEKERENYEDFKRTILVDLLEYPPELIKFEVERVEFSVTDDTNKTHVVFEAKGTKTKDLFARQNYGKKEMEHPVLQTNTDMQRFDPPASYGVCTNYDDFVLLDQCRGITKCHRFKFTDIEDKPDKLKEFIGIFSYNNLAVKASLVDLLTKSDNVEKSVTRDFYKLFHTTRLMLIKAFGARDGVTRDEAISATQLFLNRLVFIFFVQDKGYIDDNRLFAKRLLQLLELRQSTEHSHKVYDEIMELFVAFDKGSPHLAVSCFNGGLFKDEIPKKIYFSDLRDPEFFSDIPHVKFSKKLPPVTENIVSGYRGQLNPIITNLLLMDAYDFDSEVNVNILGHIFEQSISDVEDLKKATSSKRKKDGVYYTPEEITDYICRNTIIPYLSKTGATTTYELVDEYEKDIEELEIKFKNLKILDPACGSGAFLNKAVDVLMEIHEAIQAFKGHRGEYTMNDQVSMDKWNEESQIRMIIENNIYGVDVNPESVEITQLSLFLKLAARNRKLIGLSKNIKHGNSLIGDRSVSDDAFCWESEFPFIFHDPNLKKHEKEFASDGGGVDSRTALTS